MPVRCQATPDLLSWTPPDLVERFDDRTVRAASLRDRIAHGVAQTLRDAAARGQERDAIAAAMTTWLGEEVSLHMLNAYASEAKSEHTINFLRVLALVHVTGDVRLLQMAAEMFGRAVVEERHLPWIEVGLLSEKREELDRVYEATRRAARRGGRS